jgi:hypothetical protein
MANLAAVHVKRRHKLDIAATIAADGLAHDALEVSALTIPIVLDTLDQSARAIPDTRNGHFNILSHRHAISRRLKSRTTEPDATSSVRKIVRRPRSGRAKLPRSPDDHIGARVEGKSSFANNTPKPSQCYCFVTIGPAECGDLHYKARHAM